MALKDDIQSLDAFYKSKEPTLAHNARLFSMFEGELLDFILADLKVQLSDKAFDIAKHRVAPINILIRLIDKLSKIYIKGPKRTVIDGNDNDVELLRWYEEKMHFDAQMNQINELFNLHKTVTIEPFLQNGFPQVRGIPADRSLWWSNDVLNPVHPTHWIKQMGTQMVGGRETDVKFVYTDDEFQIVDKDFKVIPQLMNASGLDGTNSFGKIPGVYINRSLYSIVPPVDTDLERMVKLFPIMLSDMNFAIMMQAFSIFFGIDIDDQNITLSPNAFWSFKTDPASKNAPQIGTLKPDVDIAETMQYMAALLQLWLNSRNVRPGTIGIISGDNAASGISKIIDESDTSEDRQKQVQFFTKGEQSFWELIIQTMHPMWRNMKQIDTNLDWSKSAKIKVEFPEQIPLSRRMDRLNEAEKELALGLTLEVIQIQKLNPGMTEDEAEDLLQKIEDNKVVVVLPEDDEDELGNQDQQQSLTNDKATKNEGDILLNGAAKG